MAVLAEGVGVGGDCGFNKANWCDNTYDSAYAVNCDAPNYLEESCGQTYPIVKLGCIPPAGQIVFYETNWGGRVLHFGSIDAVRGLRELPLDCAPGSPEPVLSDLVLRALGCMVNGMCGDTAPVDCSALKIVACFGATPLKGPAPLTVDFTNLSIGSVTSWSWNFGDSTTSTLQNPSHTYTSTGTYTVSLTVSGTRAFGADADVATKIAYVTVE